MIAFNAFSKQDPYYSANESADSDFRMPPQHSKLTLSKSETDTLRHWIEQGALYETHWSLKPIKKTELPEITDSDWARNEIDYFTLHKREKRNTYSSVNV